MKVFLTGATGFVGREVVRQLRAAGHTARALARGPDAAHAKRLASEHGIELVRGDVIDAASLHGALAGTEAVIHLVGIISEFGRWTFESVHAEGTRNVVAAARAAGVRRFVHMSAMGTRLGARSRYHTSKWAAEEAVRQSRMDWTIFRPSVIYGPGDGFVNLLAGMSRFAPVVPVIGSGQNKLQPVPVEAVATCFVKALTEPRAIGETFELGGPEVLTFVEIVDAILAVTNRRRLKLRVSMPLARLQAAVLEFVFPRLLRQAPPLNRQQLLMLEEDNAGDARAAVELFGLTMPPFSEGIGRFLRR
jgi:NADH dehydrogenase